MKSLSRMLVFTLALALTLGGAALVAPKAEAATLVYADEFNGPLDASTWQVKTPFNTNYVTGELQYYTAQNLSFQNGSARILTERRSINGYNYASAMITSLNRPKFTYGYFESRFNMPTGKGIWPAFWLTNDRTQEIDMMELIGEDPYRLYMTYHKGGTQVFQRSFSNGTDLTTGWHTIGMDWQPTYIRWYIDGALAAEYKGSIPSDPMYLIFNTAVGGAWPADPDASTPFPQNFDIDYVRVYDQKPTATEPAPTPTPDPTPVPDPTPTPTPDPTPVPTPTPTPTPTPVPVTTKVDVYKFLDIRTNTNFYTASKSERDAVIAQWSGTFKYLGVAYSLDPAKNTWPLYRFQNKKNMSFFYTASRTERDKFVANSGTWSFQGEAYKVARESKYGPAVYRFYNKYQNTYYFTMSRTERDSLIAKKSGSYVYQGVVFYLGL